MHAQIEISPPRCTQTGHVYTVTFIDARGYLHFHATRAAVGLGQFQNACCPLICLSESDIYVRLDISRRGIDIILAISCRSCASPPPRYTRNARAEEGLKEVRERRCSSEEVFQVFLVHRAIPSTSSFSPVSSTCCS